jgi:hypothetical protein
MAGGERAAAENLTGVWNGVFRQPLYGSVNFTATLIESGDNIAAGNSPLSRRDQRARSLDCEP